MKVFIIALLGFAAGDDQGFLVHHHRDPGRLDAGNRERNAEVVSGANKVVRRVAVIRLDSKAVFRLRIGSGMIV